MARPGRTGTNGTNGTNGSDGKDGADATRADPPCFDNANRYVDCGNGTVTDTVTGLIWLKNVTCLGSQNWASGNQAAAALTNGQCSLTDTSSPGDWRLPTRDEWSATIAHALALGCSANGPGTFPLLTNDAGDKCHSVGPSSFVNVGFIYWSSTTAEAIPSNAWFANLVFDELANFASKQGPLLVWPVRGGGR